MIKEWRTIKQQISLIESYTSDLRETWTEMKPNIKATWLKYLARLINELIEIADKETEVLGAWRVDKHE